MTWHYKMADKVAFIALLFGMLFASGCISPTEIKNPELESVQITSLRIEDKDNTDLKNTFFSIDHRKGIIYNAHLLPKGLMLDSAKIILTRHVDAQVKFFVGGKEEMPGSNDSIALVNWKNGIRIQVSNPTKNMFKEYQLEIRTYSFDPTTIDWQPLAGATLPTMSDAEKLVLQEYQNKLFLFMGTSAGTTSIYTTQKDTPLVWTKVNTIQPIERVKSAVIAPNGTAFLLTRSNEFLTSTGDFTQWSSANNGASFTDLLGAFIEPGEREPTVAIIHQNATQNKPYFAVLKGSELIQGEAVPSDFPRNVLPSLRLNVALHPMLFMVGSAQNASGASESARVWTTTTGLDWLRLPSKGDTQLPVNSVPPTLLYDESLGRIYMVLPANFAEAEPTHQVFYSDDKGNTWVRGDSSLMLPSTTLFGLRSHNLLGYVGDAHALYLFGGVQKDGSIPSDIWRGTPRIFTE